MLHFKSIAYYKKLQFHKRKEEKNEDKKRESY